MSGYQQQPALDTQRAILVSAVECNRKGPTLRRAEADHTNVTSALDIDHRCGRISLTVPATKPGRDGCVFGLGIQENLGTLVNDQRDTVARNINDVGHHILAGQDNSRASMSHCPFHGDLRISMLE